MKSNKLIAEFMGMETDENGMYQYTTSVDDYATDDLSYFEYSWDWLMPVVEKIELQHRCDFIATRRRATRTYDANFMDEVNNYVVYIEGCKNRQEATYKAVVEFIKKYNRNK